MTRSTNQHLSLTEESRSGTIQNREFRNEIFRDFHGAGIPTAPLALENVSFVNCSFPESMIKIIGTARLRNVEFRDSLSGGKMTFSPSVLLDTVSISGSFPTSLRASGGREFSTPPDYNQVEWALDLRAFRGEVSFYGPPLDKVLCDPARHVKVRRSTTADVDWNGLGIAGRSLWKIEVRRASVCGPHGTIAMVPNSNSPEDRVARDELGRLRDAGVLE